MGFLPFSFLLLFATNGKIDLSKILLKALSRQHALTPFLCGAGKCFFRTPAEMPQNQGKTAILQKLLL